MGIQGFIIPTEGDERIWWSVDSRGNYREEKFKSGLGNWPEPYSSYANEDYFTCDLPEALERIRTTYELHVFAEKRFKK
jgi:hypothetical protein